MSISARLLRFLCAFVLFIAIAPLPAFAQSTQTPFQQSEQTSRQIQILLTGFSGTAICALSGIDIFHPGYNCAGQKIQKDGTAPTSQVNTKPLGALGFITSGIGALYQKPASAGESIQYLASNFGIAKKTLAQDSGAGGFQSFSFLQNMFVRVRDISFLLLVFAFILIGIAIMLRFKIDPRTVMTLQNQIPKIIVAIVMITFSYTIAGALVDGMWLVTYFGINTLGSISQGECGNGGNGNTFAGVGTQQLLNNPVAFTSHVFSDAGCNGSFDGIGGLSYDIGSSMSTGITTAVTDALGFDQQSDLNCGVGINIDIGPLDLGGDPGDCIQKGIYSFLSWLISILAFLIILIAIIIALIRLWITLVKAYVYIILDVLTAPLQILVGILPGGRMGFTRWLRHITGYLLLFPASAFIIFLALAFSLNPQLNQEPVDPAQVFFPPLIGVPGSSGKLGYLIAFGLIMILPEALEMIKEAMQIKGNSRVSSAIVGGFGRGVGPATALGGLGGALFGKDKNGLSRAPRRVIEQKWMHSTRPDTLLGGGKYSPLRLWRRSADNQRQAAYDHQQQNRAYSFNAANDAYHSTYRMTGNKVQAATHAAEIMKRGQYDPEYITRHMQKNYGLSPTETADVWKKINPRPEHTAGNPTPSTTPPSGPTHLASGPSGAGHLSVWDTPSGAHAGEAPSTPGTTHPTTPTPEHTPVGGVAATETEISSPHLKVNWVGNELLKADGSGDLAPLATKNNTNTVFTPAGEVDSQPWSRLGDWLKRKGLEEA